PCRVGAPRVRTGLERGRLPRKLLAVAVQPVAEPRRLDLLAELSRRVMAAERDLPDRIGREVVPLPVEPRAGDNEVVAVGIADLRAAVDLPRPPRIFLVPEPGNIQVRHERTLDLQDPRLVLPKCVVVGMLHDLVPVRN